jgi:uncharacterized protein (TIGR02001 family)
MNYLTLAPALALLAAAAPALAQAPDGGLTLSAEATLLSDYRFRGISRSDEDPALQGAFTVQTSDGFYAGARGTTLNKAGALGDVQLDLYAGYGVDLGLGTSLDAGLLYYYFPDGDGRTDYFEPYASVSHQLGPVQATAGAKYAWDQAAIGGEDMLYLFGELETAVPTTPFTLTAGIGRQDAGAFGDYWNWSLGAKAQFGPIQAGVRYVDTDLPALPNQDAGLVFSVGVRF